MVTAVSLFSGCGGFCEGMELAGIKIKCAVELDKFAAETYRYNFPSTPLFEGDITDFLSSNSDHFDRFKLADTDIIFGGPPCQGYSQIGTRDLQDPRNSLYEQFARVVSQLRPKLFLMENVPNLVLLNKGHFRERILECFQGIGYSKTVPIKVTASEFGVPQVRQRIIFVGVRDDLDIEGSIEDFCYEVLDTVKVPRPFSVREAISDLPDNIVDSGEVLAYPAQKSGLSRFQRMMRLDSNSKPYSRSRKLRLIDSGTLTLHNHHTKEIQEKRRKLISLLKPGQKADSLPKHIWNGKRPEKWRRLDPEQPSYTILAQMHRDLSEWVHPHLQRWITVREAARLQSFHDGFIFRSSEWQMLKQIGNAVPPMLAYALGRMSLELENALAARNSADGAKENSLNLVNAAE